MKRLFVTKLKTKRFLYANYYRRYDSNMASATEKRESTFSGNGVRPSGTRLSKRQKITTATIVHPDDVVTLSRPITHVNIHQLIEAAMCFFRRDSSFRNRSIMIGSEHDVNFNTRLLPYMEISVWNNYIVVLEVNSPKVSGFQVPLFSEETVPTDYTLVERPQFTHVASYCKHDDPSKYSTFTRLKFWSILQVFVS